MQKMTVLYQEVGQDVAGQRRYWGEGCPVAHGGTRSVIIHLTGQNTQPAQGTHRSKSLCGEPGPNRGQQYEAGSSAHTCDSEHPSESLSPELPRTVIVRTQQWVRVAKLGLAAHPVTGLPPA
jgi:hypothetical protein